MNRRSFFAAMAGAPVAAVLGTPVAKSDPEFVHMTFGVDPRWPDYRRMDQVSWWTRLDPIRRHIQRLDCVRAERSILRIMNGIVSEVRAMEDAAMIPEQDRYTESRIVTFKATPGPRKRVRHA